MHYIVSLLPVILFLAFLIYIDSFKLVKPRIIVLCFFYGIAMTVAAYFFNTWFCDVLQIPFQQYSRYVAPFSEELLKIGIVLILIFKKKTGFMIDGAIYGFAVGAGFSLAENIYYIMNVTDINILIWVVRGFGTAIMHGGATALLSVIMMSAVSREKSPALGFVPGLILACTLHSLYNHFLVSPLISTLLILILLPAIMVLIFNRNENMLQQWLEIEFDTEVQLLNKIRHGEFLDTKAGAYLLSVKEQFTPEVVLDMYCFISLYLELSIKAKRNMMLKENGFPILIETDIDEKLEELSSLKRQIGKIGWITLSPLIRMNYRDLWKLAQLKE